MPMIGGVKNINNIKPAYKHTIFGLLMFNWCARFTKFIVKHRALYYALSLTWGCLQTLFGLLFMLVPGDIKTHAWTCFKQTKKSWGGLEGGLFYIKGTDDDVDDHEFGHSFQNCLFGPFVILLVTIPSAIRFWFRHIKKTKPYDAWWFEDAATQCGKYAVNYIQEIKDDGCKCS